MNAFGVVIIHYGRSAPTIRCVESLIEQEARLPLKIVIVDNFGNLRSRDFPNEIRIIPRWDNPGFGGGANAGIRNLEQSCHCLAYLVLNNDVVLKPGFIDAAIQAFDQSDVGAAGGPIRGVGEEARLWYAGGGISYLTGTVRQSQLESDTLKARIVSFIPGTALAVRREAWQEIEGFDESYFLYNEDIDLCLRLRRAGWKLLFSPEMVCIHDLGESTGSATRSALYLEQLTKTRLRPFRPKIYQIYLSVVHSIYNLARMSSIFLQRGMAGRTQIRAIFRGHSAALREVFSEKQDRREEP